MAKPASAAGPLLLVVIMIKGASRGDFMRTDDGGDVMRTLEGSDAMRTVDALHDRAVDVSIITAITMVFGGAFKISIS